jgi:serine/threonine protein kinase
MNSQALLPVTPNFVQIVTIFQLPAFRKYKISSVLSDGELSAVFVVEDRKKRRKYALKIMLHEIMQKRKQDLNRECKVQKAFVSAGIAPGVVDCGHVKDGKLVVSFIPMDFVAGVSLDAWLAAKTRSKKEMDGLFVKLTDVWRKMKSHNLGHDDLHGSNIVVTPDRSGAVKEVKILDFGHAKMRGFNLSVLKE